MHDWIDWLPGNPSKKPKQFLYSTYGCNLTEMASVHVRIITLMVVGPYQLHSDNYSFFSLLSTYLHYRISSGTAWLPLSCHCCGRKACTAMQMHIPDSLTVRHFSLPILPHSGSGLHKGTTTNAKWTVLISF